MSLTPVINFWIELVINLYIQIYLRMLVKIWHDKKIWNGYNKLLMVMGEREFKWFVKEKKTENFMSGYF